MFGIQEILIIIAGVAIIFSNKIPGLARKLGQSVNLIGKSVKETKNELKELEDQPKKSSPKAITTETQKKV